MDEVIARALARTVLASRCLDGAADDVRAFARRGGFLGSAAANALEDEALRVDEIAEAIEALRD